MEDAPKPRLKRLILLAWIIVGVFYCYLSYGYIRVSMTDRKLDDYMVYVVQLTGDQRRPGKDARALILAKAGELGLPVHGDQVMILGEGADLKISVAYEVDIPAPFVARVLYRKGFQHTVTYHLH